MYLRKSSFQFKNVETGTVLPYRTKSLECVVNGRKVLLSVWNGYNKRINIHTLNKYGWSLQYLPGQSQEYIDYNRCTYMYQRYPELVKAVKDLKQIYDDAGIAYNSSSYDMETKIMELDNPAEWPGKFAYGAEELAIELDKAYHDYLTNVEGDFDHNPVGTWSVYKELPTLIMWIPGQYTQDQVPSFLEPEDIINEEAFIRLNDGVSDVM